MKNNRGIAFIISLFFGLNLMGQQQSFSPDNFNGLQSGGSLPKDFMTSWADKFNRTHGQNLAGAEDEVEDLDIFWQQQHRQIDALLQSGQFSFGDPITVYLNEVADKLLASNPELRKKVRIYTFKSPSVNAFCVADGIVAVHSGLVAHVNSEAELAFVLAHEISHYTKEHMFDRYKERKSLESSGWFSQDLNPVAKFDRLTERSKEHELEADAEGVSLFLNSPYHPGAINDAFTTLHESYISYGREAVGKDFLATAEFTLPDIYFRDEVAEIKKEEDYFDETHQHPNIATRRKELAAQLAAVDSASKAYFIQPRAKFEEIRTLARFEALREKLLYREYGSALYDLYLLQKQYPNNRFLDLTQGRVLYGLASYKAIDKISEVVETPSRIEGPSQQVYHILKQLNSKQIVTLALHHNLQLKKKYPEEKVLDKYIDILARNLVVECDLEADDFAVKADSKPTFDKAVSDFPSERHYLRAKQNFYRDFYKFLLKSEYEQGWLKSKMAEFKTYKDSIKKDQYLSIDEREDQHEAEMDYLEEFGSDLNIRKLIILDPTIRVVGDAEDTEEQLEALMKEEEFKTQLAELVKQRGIDANLLYVEDMSPEEIDRYNKFSSLEEWLNEARAFRRRKLTPTSIDIAKRVKTDSRYVCRIFGIIEDGSNDYYYFGIYDLKKGEVVYERGEEVGRNLSMKDLLEETQYDLDMIYN